MWHPRTNKISPKHKKNSKNVRIKAIAVSNSKNSRMIINAWNLLSLPSKQNIFQEIPKLGKQKGCTDDSQEYKFHASVSWMTRMWEDHTGNQRITAELFSNEKDDGISKISHSLRYSYVKAFLYFKSSVIDLQTSNKFFIDPKYSCIIYILHLNH